MKVLGFCLAIAGAVLVYLAVTGKTLAGVLNRE
jgi:hypothetical protein